MLSPLQTKESNGSLIPHMHLITCSLISAKGAKLAVYAILGNAGVTDQELTMAFTGVEALLNSECKELMGEMNQ